MSNALPKALTLPLRDLVRGMRQHAGPAGAVVAHALEALPGPLRHVARDITPFDPNAAELSDPPTPETLSEAAAAMGSSDADLSATRMATCASFAISVLLADTDTPDLLVSETILALCWRDARAQPTRAAAFLHAMMQRQPFSVAPGLMGTALDRHKALKIGIGTVLWLLAEPDTSATPEVELVRISGWLGAGALEAVEAAWDNPQALNGILLDVATRI